MKTLDITSLAALALGLAAFEVALSQAPDYGWASNVILGLLASSLAAGTLFVGRTLHVPHPIVDLRLFSDRSFAVGCALSFTLGIGLFGTIYLMPVFLGLVRGHSSLEIGEIMLVTGVAQLVTAPLAVVLEQRVDARLLSATSFLVFGVGLGLSFFQTNDTDFAGMFWPQVIRGVSVMLCLLAPTSLALGRLAPALVADGSGLFNLMRNLGGAVGLAMIDSLIYGRVPVFAQAIFVRLKAGDIATAKAIGLPLDVFVAKRSLPLDDATRLALSGYVKKAALAQAISEAWALIAILTLASIAALLLVRSISLARNADAPSAVVADA